MVGTPDGVRVEARTFDSWYQRLAPRVVRTLLGISGDRELAADLTADAFTKAYGRWERISTGEKPPDAWVFRVAVNLLRRHWRLRRARARKLPDWIIESETSDPEPDIDLWHAVATLPPRQRQVVVLRYMGDLTEGQIGTVLGVTEGAVSSSLTKARDALRSQLVAEDSDA